MTAEAENAQPINDGVFNRLLTLLVVKGKTQKYLKRVFGYSSGPISLSNIYIKVKPFDNLAEAHAMQLVAERTSVPVPHVHCAFMHKGDTYIVMSRINGQPVGYGWKGRSDESKARILKQLWEMLADLRDVFPPADPRIGNVTGGPFYDSRSASRTPWGPYSTVRAFYTALVNNASLDGDYFNTPNEIDELFDTYRNYKNKKLVLTHGNLSSLNIMVQGDQVVGIIDWEAAGWFPPYWEYTSAKSGNPDDILWEEEIDRFLPPFPSELTIENIRRKYYGTF